MIRNAARAIASLLVANAFAASERYCIATKKVTDGWRNEVVSAPKYGVDLGVIDQHRKVDCSFSITNRNWRERKVLGVRGNCACLETETELKTLARGWRAGSMWYRGSFSCRAKGRSCRVR